MNQIVGLDAGKLPNGIRSRFVEGVKAQVMIDMIDRGAYVAESSIVALVHS